MADTTTQFEDKHEPRDVSGWKLALFAIAFVLLLIVASVALWLTYGSHSGSFSAAQNLGQVPNDTELYQREQLAKYRAAQDAELSRLAWTNSSKQFAKVPIDDAMNLLAAKGATR